MRLQRLRPLLPDALAILALIILPLLVFWQVWATNSADRVMFGGDILMGAYPTRVFVHQLFNSGAAPLWNAYQLGGMPLLGDVQVAPYYLPNLLLDVIYRGRDITYISFELLVAAHYVLGGVFFYAYMRGIGVRPTAALVGAIGFEFNGFFVGHRGHYNMMAAAAWLPGVLWLLDRSWYATRRVPAIAWALAAGLALSQMVMAGHPQAVLYCSLAIVGYAGYRWVGDLRRKPVGWAARLRIPALFVLTGVLAAGIAAVALLPAIELIGRSRRSELSYTFAEQYSLMPRNLLGLLVPDFLDWGTTEYRIYAGVLTLVLAAAAWVVPANPRPERRFFTLAALLALITALGGFTVLHGMIYRFVPGFASIRVSARAFYIANLTLCALAALGAENLIGALAEDELRRLRGLTRIASMLLATALLIGIGLYALLISNYHPVGEGFFFAESLFSRLPSADVYTMLTQTANAYGVFLLLLAGAVILIWARSAGRLSGRGMALAAALLMCLDVTTFAPYHDTVAADPATARFTVRKYATGLLDAPWKITDQDALITALRRLPPGVRVDNAAEVLPDNYSQVYGIPFATGYNILDIAERFQMLTEWPNLSDATRRDLLNVGYVLTLPDAADPPELGAKLLIKNSQGQLWQRAQQPSYAHFSSSLRPAATMITLNGLLSRPGVASDTQPTVSADGGQLHTILRQLWPEALDKPLYAIGTTGVQSPVDISVLAGGPIQYSAVIVDGVTVTPRQRGIVLAMIDPTSGKLIAADGFDTYASSDESIRMAALISSATNGTIVALATYDEGTVSLGDAGRAAIASLGAKIDLRGQSGAAYALVGVKGAATGSALEQIGKTPLTLDVGVGALAAQPNAQFTSSLLSYQPDQISLLVQNSVRGLLTVSESVYPGWDAYVDGLPTTTLRVNGLLRGVIVPPALDGHPHEVTFIYRPLSARLGGAISLLSLSLAAGTLLAFAAAAAPRIAWRRRKPIPPRPLLGQGPSVG
jgi:Interleukin-like EMT inducer